MKKKIAYASKLGIPYVVIIGEDEVAAGAFSLKDLRTGEQVQVSLDQLLQTVRDLA
jgi:histidyl-tRNA synthetase